MTLEQYAAIAEITGVILVVASLVYVAKQLNQDIVQSSLQNRLDRELQTVIADVSANGMTTNRTVI